MLLIDPGIETTVSKGNEFEKYRDYLLQVARFQLDPRLQRKIDASDLVQQTLMVAHAKEAQFRGSGEEERLAWLKKMLANNLLDAVRALRREKRDIRREVSIDPVEKSSMRISDWLAVEQSSPSQKMVRHDEAIRLSDALNQLPDPQREAITLKHWHGWTLKDIADHMDRSQDAVAGLLKRGLKTLRSKLT